MFKGKKILITGGTGSLGQALTKRLLTEDVDTIRIFSRNENKQVVMESEIPDERLRFLIGDIRDFPRFTKAVEGIDIVFHTAALKHVPVVEYNPFEAVKTNVVGSQNVIEACIRNNVGKVIAVSTDKAVSPLNSYGATKLLMEKLFVTAGNYIGKEHITKFTAMRYGNVLGSSGSVVPKFINQIKEKKEITVTDPEMTRFSITMDHALDFILESTKLGKGSEIFVPVLQAYKVGDIIEALKQTLGDFKINMIPKRSGEKIHETLINKDEMEYTYKIGDKYVIKNPLDGNNGDSDQTLEKINDVEEYSSNKADKLPTSSLIEYIKNSCICGVHKVVYPPS